MNACVTICQTIPIEARLRHVTKYNLKATIIAWGSVVGSSKANFCDRFHQVTLSSKKNGGREGDRRYRVEQHGL